jgi:hypothetical protein
MSYSFLPPARAEFQEAVELYQIRSDEILIVAVAHFRRDPTYWRNRIDP